MTPASHAWAEQTTKTRTFHAYSHTASVTSAPPTGPRAQEADLRGHQTVGRRRRNLTGMGVSATTLPQCSLEP